MRVANVYYNQHFVGILREENRERNIMLSTYFHSFTVCLQKV